mmetsp:Transcript_37293/g.68212  ORF Transcript_37293/g.68212 Transcript_37293/m.68212 type:complete len:105 (-) Transcript_37293:968-1282(-)
MLAKPNLVAEGTGGGLKVEGPFAKVMRRSTSFCVKVVAGALDGFTSTAAGARASDATDAPVGVAGSAAAAAGAAGGGGGGFGGDGPEEGSSAAAEDASAEASAG